MSAAATTIQTESHGRVRRVLVNDLTVLRSGPSLMAFDHTGYPKRADTRRIPESIRAYVTRVTVQRH